MNFILKFILLLISILFLFYVLLPTPSFPEPGPDFRQSVEEADTETPLKKAYFTNLTREEVMAHYKNEFKKSGVGGFLFPIVRLNYPPEEAQILIRDQTRSTFLEELVHPLRESFYVNGFEPTMAKDEIWYKGEHFQQKITVKYSQTNSVIRLFITILSICSGAYLFVELRKTTKWIFR